MDNVVDEGKYEECVTIPQDEYFRLIAKVSQTDKDRVVSMLNDFGIPFEDGDLDIIRWYQKHHPEVYSSIEIEARGKDKLLGYATCSYAFNENEKFLFMLIEE